MSQQQQEEPPSIIEQNTLVDTDIHVNEVWSAEDLIPYVDEPYISRLKVSDMWPVTRQDGFDRSLGGKIDLHAPDSPNTVYEDLKGFGVDYPIINPGSSLPGVPVADFAVELMSAFNNYMLDNFLDVYDNYYGLAGLAPQKPDKAAEELDRLGNEKKIVGAYIRTSGPNIPWGDPHYDMVYEAAEDNDLDIAFHAGAGDFINDFSKQYQTLNSFLEAHALAHPWGQMLTLTSIIYQGVPEKFPSLNFVFLEAGVGWAGYMMGRLNEEYYKRKSEAPMLKKSPEEYIRESCYFSQQPIPEFENPEHLKYLFDLVGTENIVFSTDYPHWEFDHPNVLESFLERYYSEDDWENILGKNAMEAFGIKL